MSTRFKGYGKDNELEIMGMRINGVRERLGFHRGPVINNVGPDNIGAIEAIQG